MRFRTLTLSTLAVLVSALAMTPSTLSRPGVDVELGLSMPVGDHGRLWLDIASRHYDYEPQLVAGWASHYSDPDDLAVSLFLSKTSGRDPDVVFALRKQNLSWWDVGLRVGVPMDAWFVAVERDPGPPYGRAYGHWKKHRKNPKHRVILNDRDCRDLVALRMAHSYFGVSPETAMEWRREHGNVQGMMVSEYEKRHGKNGAKASGPDDHGNGKGKQKSGKGHGKGSDR